MSIPKIIKAGRERLGLNEQAFADRLGVTRGTVQQWENGKTAPNRKRQPDVASLLGITVAELMGLDERPSNVTPLLGWSQPHGAPAPAPVTFDDAVRVIAQHLQQVDTATRRRAMVMLADLGEHADDYESIGAAAQAVLATGKRLSA